MKKVFLGLLVAGVALAGSAFTNAHKVFTYKYSPVSTRAAGGIYVLNATGLVQESDYQCISSSKVCTFQSDTPITGTDLGGTYISPAPVQNSPALGTYQPL